MEQFEENELELALRLAADEPGHRPNFYTALLDAQVFVICPPGPKEHGIVDLQAGDKVSIVNWERPDGTPVIPFFTSLPALQRAIEDEVSYMAFPTRDLFQMTMGATLFLNPKSDYGKEFFPQEIETLLSSGVNQAAEQRVVQKETKVLLGQPAKYPSRMVSSLTTLFAKHANVKSAYLTLMHDPSVDEKPHLLVGVEVDGNIEKVMREAGTVAAESCDTGEPVDLYLVTPEDSGLSSYFRREVKPFYERSWGGKLKSLFGIGHD